MGKGRRPTLEEQMQEELEELGQLLRPEIPGYAKSFRQIHEETGIAAHTLHTWLRKEIVAGRWKSARPIGAGSRNVIVYWKVQ